MKILINISESASSAATTVDAKVKLTALRKEVRTLRNNIAALDLQLAKESKKLSAKEKLLAAKVTKIGVPRPQSELRKEVKALRTTIANLNAQRAKESKKLATKEKQVAANALKTSGPTKPTIRIVNKRDAGAEVEPNKPSNPKDPKAKVEKLTGTFDPKVMKGKEWFIKINGQSKGLRNIEGFWRAGFRGNRTGLPFPVVYKPAGYNKAAFVKALLAAQEKAFSFQSKGMSPHRWGTGYGTLGSRSNKSNEYKYKGWRWPGGYITYIKQGVPPSRPFYKMIMNKDLPSLPVFDRNLQEGLFE